MNMNAIGINIYGGGFTLGVQSAGWNVLGQWEECSLGAKTFDMNFKNIHHPLDIRKWPISKCIGRIPFVFGNPPCAPWSSANARDGHTKEKRFNDPRLELTRHTYMSAMHIKPEVFISESVENAYNFGKPYYDYWKQQWMDAGYSVTYFLTDAVLHGSPSIRRRFHFIAHKHKLQIADKPDREKAVTVRDAIGDLIEVDGRIQGHNLTKLNPRYSEVFHKVPPYGKLDKVIKNSPEYDGPRCSFLIRKLAWDAPASTMVGFSYIHPDGERWITFREALRLCTYPDNFMTHNAVEAVDAVLPTVANFLGNMVKETIEKSESTDVNFNFIDWRDYGKKFHYKNMFK